MKTPLQSFVEMVKLERIGHYEYEPRVVVGPETDQAVAALDQFAALLQSNSRGANPVVVYDFEDEEQVHRRRVLIPLEAAIEWEAPSKFGDAPHVTKISFRPPGD